MSSGPSICKDDLIDEARRLGITDIGIAAAEPVDPETMSRYSQWIAEGCHGTMSYLERYPDLRADPRLILPEARSIITAAFNYYPAQFRQPDNPRFAYYAYGRDYHEVVRERLSRLADYVTQLTGAATRVCVDTAPVLERYWAVKSGLGFKGLNSLLILPSRGSYFFLGEILTTAEITPTEPCNRRCGDCGACQRACPAGAIKGDGTIDASRCLSYLTIEYRGELPDSVDLGNRIYGCDTCQRVCPHNRKSRPTEIEDFTPSPEFLALDRDEIANLTPERFNALFRHSAIKRTKLSGLLRNLNRLSPDNQNRT